MLLLRSHQPTKSPTANRGDLTVARIIDFVGFLFVVYFTFCATVDAATNNDLTYQQFTLQPSDAGPEKEFGSSVDLYGDVVVVGAPDRCLRIGDTAFSPMGSSYNAAVDGDRQIMSNSFNEEPV
jgi:hypothetical protein